MKCPKDQLGLYLDNSLNDLDNQHVKDHLSHCPSCRGELAEMQRIFTLLRPSETPEPGVDFLSSVMLAIGHQATPLEIEYERRQRMARYLGWGSLALGIGGLALLLIVFWGTVDIALWSAGIWLWSKLVLLQGAFPSVAELVERMGEVVNLVRILLDSLDINPLIWVALGAIGVLGWTMAKEIVDDLHQIMGYRK